MEKPMNVTCTKCGVSTYQEIGEPCLYCNIPKKVYILVGVSGSGKTTWTNKLRCEDEGRYIGVVSSDFFPGLYGENGKFNGHLLPQSHAACLRNFVGFLLNSEVDILVVDNTNTTVTEIAPYAALALAYGWELEIIKFNVDVEVAAKRNVHGVPEKGVAAQAARIKQLQLPPWWPVREV